MKTNTSKLTFASIFSAVVTAVAYITTSIGTMQLAAAVISTLAVMLVMKYCGKKFAFAHYISVGVLLFVFLPGKLYSFIYLLFFGLYAILKLFIEERKSITTEWVLKIIYFAVISAIGVAGYVFLFLKQIYFSWYIYMAVYLILIVLMSLYDVFLTIFGNQFFILTDKYLKKLK